MIFFRFGNRISKYFDFNMTKLKV